jgi:DNA-binding XRE family transcriptional regulator
MTGKELKKWRNEHGLTQAALAKSLNVAWATVARWEIDVRKIPPYLHLALTTIANDLTMKGGDKENALRKKKKR